MDGALKRRLFEEIDIYVEQKQRENPDGNVAELMKPEVERLSKQNGIDMIDLFVEYMDHVSIKSKRYAQAEAERKIDVDSPDLRLY